LTILDRWSITAEELTALVDSTPSLRGILLGYVAEAQLEKLLGKLPGVEFLGRPDDHDRTRKGDRIIQYGGVRLIVESKSLQTNTVKRRLDPETGRERWEARAQVDASDRRTVKLPGGGKLQTTCLLRGEFDLLAVNCFAFEKQWRFAFAKNSDLPGSTYSKYTARQKKYLLASLVTVTWPPQPPFVEDPLPLLRELARERNR
jgi:hypothetical protein